MLIETRRELGLSIQALYALKVPSLSGSAILDYGGGIEGNLSLYMGKMGLDAAPVGFKLGLNYTTLSDSFYVASITPVKAMATRWMLYLKKDIYFLSIFHVGLLGGVGYDVVDKTTPKETDPQKSFSSLLIPVGTEIGMNLFWKMQVFGLLEYSIPIAKRFEDGKTKDGLPKWYTMYPERKGATVRAGLRFSF